MDRAEAELGPPGLFLLRSATEAVEQEVEQAADEGLPVSFALLLLESELIQELCHGALRKAAVEGETDLEGSVIVGQNIGLLKRTQGAAEIMAELIRDYTALLGEATSFLDQRRRLPRRQTPTPRQ